MFSVASKRTTPSLKKKQTRDPELRAMQRCRNRHSLFILVAGLRLSRGGVLSCWSMFPLTNNACRVEVVNNKFVAALSLLMRIQCMLVRVLCFYGHWPQPSPPFVKCLTIAVETL
ncbi:unnamed protein product, partial [Ascophyllum nodosum]